MKQQVILNKPQNQIPLEDINPRTYFGSNIGDKAFLVREEFDAGNFRWVCLSDLTAGNHYDSHQGCSVEIAVKNMLQAGYIVFQFTSGRELLTWLLEP